MLFLTNDCISDLMSLTAVGTLAAFFCFVTTIQCIRKKKTSAGNTLCARSIS